jgi:hypothetical protein
VANLRAVAPVQAEVSMNRRLPRIALLVVLLVSLFGLLTLGDASPARISLAQDQELCPTPPATPAPMGSELDIEKQAIDLDDRTSPVVDVSVQQVWLAAGETVSILADPNVVLYVAAGSVTLTVCDGDSVTVTSGPGGTVTPLDGPNTMPLDLDDTVYATSTVRYYLTGVDPESRIVLTLIIPGGGAVCGGTSC